MNILTRLRGRKPLPLTPWIDLSDELQGRQIFAWALDYAGRLFVLTTRPGFPRYESNASGVRFPVAKTQAAHEFVVFEATESDTTRYTIPNQQWNYHFVQPLPDDELLLVCARSNYRGRDNVDLNACVFSHDGVLKREFLLGDGIRDVQTTRSGTIWTSYFDEGVFGNFGWDSPIGEPGLIRWDDLGHRLWQFQPTGGMNLIADCYALNVVSDTEAWFYYYTEFPLVRWANGRVQDYWATPVQGAAEIALWQDYVLFCGSYTDDRFRLYRLEPQHKLKPLGVYQIETKSDELTARAQWVVLRRGHTFLRLDLSAWLRG